MANVRLAGTVLTGAGVAVVGATVELFDRDTTTPLRATFTGGTDANGDWNFSYAPGANSRRVDVRVTNGTSISFLKQDDEIQVASVETEALRILNPNFDFEYDFVPAAITAARALNLPLLTGTGTIAVLENVVSGGQTFAGAITFSLAGSAVTISGNTGNTLVVDTNVLVVDATNDRVMINDTANVNNLNGLTVNQEGADDHIFTGKSSDVAHGLTDGFGQAIETDDFFVINKYTAAAGGARIQAVATNAANNVTCGLHVLGGQADITDTTSSVGLLDLYMAEHDGANALRNAAVNQNILSIRSRSGAANVTRLILKGDDGELHLGNTTLVALDVENDALVIRAMQRSGASGGIIESRWDNPMYNYHWLRDHKLAGDMDKDSFFLFPLQTRLHLHEGAIWQNYCRTMNIEERLELVETENKALRQEVRALRGG